MLLNIILSYRDGLAGKAISFFSRGDKMAAPEAVIEIGATGVRLLVAEVTNYEGVGGESS